MRCIGILDIKEEPHNVDIEQQVLGSIFLEEKLFKDIVDRIDGKMFFEQQHRDIFESMVYLHFNNEIIDYTKVIGRLEHNKKKYDIDYVISLTQCVPSIANFENYVSNLIELYEKRSIYNFGKKVLVNDISNISSNEIIKDIQSVIDRMSVTSNLEISSFNEYIDDWVEWLESEDIPQKYKFGLKELDDTVLLEDSNLVIVASRPSVGKSALALTFVKNFLKQGYQTLFVSLEMSRKEIMNRLVANIAHIPSQKLKRKEPLSKEEKQSVMDAKEVIRNFNMNVYDKSGMKIEQLEGLAKKLKKDGKLDILVVDYLQLLETYKRTNGRTQEVELVSRKLKQLASELDIPVIALSQLSRANVEHGKAREPQLSDLRQSGAIEQDANTVIMLHSQDVDNKFQDRKFLDLFVRKNRDGRLGHMKYTYYGDYIQFIEKKYNEQGTLEIVEQEELFKEYNEFEYKLMDNQKVTPTRKKTVKEEVSKETIPDLF